MYIKREIEGEIINYLSKREIIAVIGPRQSGKTTMIKQILSKYDNVNHVVLDDINLLSLFKNDIKSFIELYIKNYKYVFIDEIQYAEDSGKQLKFIYDTMDVKLIVSGSSAAEISIQSLKYLVGRIFVFTLYPFSYKEFLSAKNPKILKLYAKQDYGKEIGSELQKYIQEFLTYGGYPRVVLAKDVEEKRLVLANIYNTLLLREIKDLFGLSENEKLVKFIKTLSNQIGNLLNYSELSSFTSITFPQVKRYLQILEETFICQRCYSFSSNKRTEIVRTPKIYFLDHGIRNIVNDNFNFDSTDKGALYENLVFSEHLKKSIELKYWRTKSGAEVDFILNNEPIEIKSIPKTSRSFFSFIKKYQPKNGYIISEGEKGAIERDGCNISFLPFHKFI